MIDPVAAATLAIATPSPAGFGLLFLAGVVTSVGPCVAPRYLTLAALTSGDRRPLLPSAAFVAGLIGAFAALGYVAGLLGTVWAWSTGIYLLLAIGLFGGGCVTLICAVPTDRSKDICCAGGARTARSTSIGASFLLGAASAFIISPCCTPIVAAVVAASMAIGKPLVGFTLLASFAVGHTLPLFCTGTIGAVMRKLLPSRITPQAPAIVGAVLMLALGVYYGILA